MLKTLDQLKIHNKIKCELCIYKYKKPNYYWEYFFKKLFEQKNTEIKKNLKKPKPVPGGCTVRAPSPSAFYLGVAQIE